MFFLVNQLHFLHPLGQSLGLSLHDALLKAIREVDDHELP